MPKDRSSRGRGRGQQKFYDRNNDCWNCGSSRHLRKQCPVPGTLQCSHCRRRGIRTDECRCQQTSPKSRNRSRYETAVLLNIEGKHVRAVINTGAQETRIGLGVLEFLKSKRAVNSAKRIITTDTGIETLQATEVRMGDPEHLYEVECFIDPRTPKFEIIIGLRALVRLGYRITVCGHESRQRKVSNERSTRACHRESPKAREDDEISFLDENEARRIREWMD